MKHEQRSETKTPLQSLKVCDKPERTRSIGGIRLTNILQHLGVCADCIEESSVYGKLVARCKPVKTPRER